MMLGVLLARAGVHVVVLEKHADFLRDFRGDTVHPSTLEVMYELGVLDDFLARPHSELREVRGMIGDERVTLADFSHLPVHAPFIAMMPQWDFLDFLAEQGRRYPTFQLVMQAEVFELIERDARVVGVRAQTPGETLDIYANLVVGADGRSSTVRSLGRLPVQDVGAPIDVLWMRFSKKPDDSATAALGNVRNGHVFVMLDRGDYWQCAYVIRKGGYDELRRAGLDAFRAEIVSVVPFLSDRVAEIRSWDAAKLLTVKIDRLRQWHRPGLLCIGDAAHAMSPVGGVGINLAIQDAVATANILSGPLGRGTPASARAARARHAARAGVHPGARAVSHAEGRRSGEAADGRAAAQQVPDAAAHSGATGGTRGAPGARAHAADQEHKDGEPRRARRARSLRARRSNLWRSSGAARYGLICR